jgi:RHS repeat-associated protein
MAPTPSLATGVVTTVAGSGSSTSSPGTGSGAGISVPQGVAVVGNYAYTMDLDNVIMRTTVAGSGIGTATIWAGQVSQYENGYCMDSSAGSGVQFNDTNALVTNGTILYSASSACGVRATNLTNGGTVTLTSTTARGLTVGSDGNLYFATTSTPPVLDELNTSTNAVTTVSQTLYPQGDGGCGLTADTVGNLYVCVTNGTTQAIYQFAMSSATVTTYISDPELNSGGIFFAGGYLYASVGYNLSQGARIRRYASNGVGADVAGGPIGHRDATGDDAQFGAIAAIGWDGTNLFVADQASYLREVSPGISLPGGQQPTVASAPVLSLGGTSTIAGSAGSISKAGMGTSAGFEGPRSTVVVGNYAYTDDFDNVIMQTEVTGSNVGQTTVWAGSESQPQNGSCADGSPGSNARFYETSSLATDGTFLYSASAYCGVRKTDLIDGSTVIISNIDATGITLGSDGNLYFTTYAQNSQIDRLNLSNDVVSTLPNTPSGAYASTCGFTADQSNNLYMCAPQTTVNGNVVFPVVSYNDVTGQTRSVANLLSTPNPQNFVMSGLSYLGGQLLVNAINSTTGGTTTSVIYSINSSSGGTTFLAGAGQAAQSYVVNGNGSAARIGQIQSFAASGSSIIYPDYNGYIQRMVQAPPPAIANAQTYGSQSGCSCQANVTRSSVPDVKRGDPVNTATGAFTYQMTDATLPGRGVTFSMTRTYNSSDTTSGPFGVGWTDPYQASLTIPNGAATVTFRAGDGAQSVYTLVGSAYVAPSGIRSALTVVSGGYQVTNPDGTTMSFTSTGLLSSIMDRHGEGVTLGYVGGQLTTVTDAAQRVVTFSYTGSLITGLAMPGSRSVVYGYTSGQLTSATDMAGNKWTYGYGPVGRLTTIKTPRGNTITKNTYATGGRVSSQLDANGNTTTFGWTGDTNGNGTATTTDPDGGVWTDVYSGNMLVSSTDPDGRTTSYAYDPNGDRTVTTDPAGHVTTYAYDSSGDLLSQTDPLLNSESWTYNSLSEPLTATDFRGQTTTYTYNAVGDMLSETTAAGYESTWTWNSDGTMATAVNPLGNVSGATPAQYTTNYSYDTSGQLKTVTDPYGNITSYGYDSSGRRTSTVDPRGNVSGGTPANYTTTQSYTADDLPWVATEPDTDTVTDVYDADDDLHTVTDEDGNTTAYGYDPMDRRNSTTTARGYTTTDVLDWAGRVLTDTDPNNNVTTNKYDVAGQLTTTVAPRGNVNGATAANFTTTYGYDPDGRLTTSSQPLNATTTALTTTNYDADGNAIAVIDPDGNTATTTYDADHDKLTMTTARGDTTTWTYTVDDQIHTITDANGHTSTYTYAANGQQASVTDPDSHLTTYAYDYDGRLGTKTAPGSLVTTYAYDPASNLNSTTYSDGVTHSVTATWDPEDRRTQMIDATGTTNETFYPSGLLKSMTTGANKTVSYTYTADDLPLTIVYPATTAHPSGRTVTDGYDNGDRLTSVQDWLTHTTTFGYDPDGDITPTTYPNGITDTRTYDYGDELTAISDATSSTTLAAFSYGYDADSQLTSESDTLNGATTNSTYSYTADNELQTDPTGTYTDDPANQLTTLSNGTVQNYDNAGELTSSVTGGATTSYSENTRGDRTAITPPSGTATALTYTQADQLASYTKASTSVSYTYNGDGLRAAATGATTATYTWNMTASTPTLLDDNTISYLYGPNGPIETVTDSGDTPAYLLGDHQESTRLITNAAGGQTGSFTYNSYGTVSTHTGIYTPLRFDGQYNDPTTNILYMRARDYDATTAQFLTSDPLESVTGQPYAYADNNPLDLADPTGLAAPPWLRDIVDVGQDPLYLGYWGTYEEVKSTNGLAAYCGAVQQECSTTLHLLNLPSVPIEAAGLGGDALGNVLKGETIWQEDVNNQPLFGNQVGGPALSRWVGCLLGSSTPTHMKFPGFNYRTHHIDFAW